MKKKPACNPEIPKKRQIVLVVLIIVFLILIIALITTGGRTNDPNDFTIEHPEVGRTTADTIRFCDDVQTMLFEIRIEHSEIVFAQAQLETANFTSDIWNENNNMFGMKAPSKRVTTCIGVNRSHAVYLNWRYSVMDYALWQTAYARGLTEDEYYAKLQAVYAEDPLYSQKLKEMVRKNRIKI